MKKPLNFGEILDQTFRIMKNHFGSFFMISFLIMVPILAIQSLILLASGRSFFTSIDQNQNIFQQIMESAETNSQYGGYPVVENLGQQLLLTLTQLIVIFVAPIIAGAIVMGVKKARDGESFQAMDMIKKALPRYWPILGSTVLIGIIIGAIVLGATFISVFTIVGLFQTEPVLAIVVMIVFFIGVFLGLGLLLTRWSLFIPAVLFEKVAPGISKSWRLTKRQTWKFFGMYLILYILVTIFVGIMQLIFSFLGNSVLYHLLFNLVTMITSIVFAVGYSVMYFDATVRQEATDLQEMIEDYEETEQY